jgi:hypothetical protein
LQDTGVYPDGMPHPTGAQRRRILLDLMVLAGLTALYLRLFLDRPLVQDIGMALVGMGLVGLLARKKSEQLWGPPSSPDFERTRRCAISMTLLTLPPLVGFFLYGAWSSGYEAWRTQPESAEWAADLWAIVNAVALRLFRWQFFVTLLFFIPWALVQQALFQFYLLARWRALLPYASPLFLSFINGLLYGGVHLPEWPVAVVTMIGGMVWSYSYFRDRYVLPLAVSHAVLGATFYYWVCNVDLFGNLTDSLSQVLGW